MESVAAQSTAISSKADELLENYHEKLFALGLDVTFNRSTLATKYWLSLAESNENLHWTVSNEDEKQLESAFTQCKEHLEQFEEAAKLENGSGLSKATGAFAQDVRKISRLIDACRDSSGSESSQGGSQRLETQASEPQSQYEALIPPPGIIDNTVALGEQLAARTKKQKAAVTVLQRDLTDSQANLTSSTHGTNNSPLAQSEHSQSFSDTSNTISRTRKGTLETKRSTKEKLAVPISPSFEGYVYTVLDPIGPGETASWVRTRRTQMLLTSQELYDKALAHMKKTGLSVSGQMQSLGTNQQTLVKRLLEENSTNEKEPNVVWTLFGIKKLHEERKTTFKTWRVNNAILVTLRRGERTQHGVQDLRIGEAPHAEVDKVDIPESDRPVAKKIRGAPLKTKREKKAKASDLAAEYQGPPRHGDPLYRDGYVDPYSPFGDFQPQDQPGWSHAHPDPFSMYDMSGALPEGAIPVPPANHHRRESLPLPRVPTPPSPLPLSPLGYPFPPYPRDFPLQQSPFAPLDERHPRDFEPRIRAHSASHSRTRHDVRDEIGRAVRTMPAEDTVIHRRPTAGSAISSISTSRRSYAAASSAGRSYGFSSPGTSPERSERERPGQRLRRRDSFDSRRYMHARYGYMDRDARRYMDTWETYRERDRGEDIEHSPRRMQDQGQEPSAEQQRESRERFPDARVAPDNSDLGQSNTNLPPFGRDRRYYFDGYPVSRQPSFPRERSFDTPHAQRRVTDYPEALRDPDYRRRDRGVDYERIGIEDWDISRLHSREEERDRRSRNPGQYW